MRKLTVRIDDPTGGNEPDNIRLVERHAKNTAGAVFSGIRNARSRSHGQNMGI